MPVNGFHVSQAWAWDWYTLTQIMCKCMIYNITAGVATSDDLGIELLEPPPGSDDVCLRSDLTFRCTTTGRGDTKLMFEGISVSVPAFRFRHALYNLDTPNQENNDNRLDGDLRAGNLSRRSDRDNCFNSQHNTSDCYTTSLVVRLTDRTMCGVIICSTIFNNGTEDIPSTFGNTTIARSELYK